MGRKPTNAKQAARKAAAKPPTLEKKTAAKPGAKAKTGMTKPAEPKAAKVRGYSKDGLKYAKGLRD